MYLNTIRIEAEEDQEELADIIEGLSFLCSTWTGKYPMNRDFGIDQNLLDEPLTTVEPLLAIEIKDKIERYEKRVEVLDVEFEYNADENTLTPIVSLDFIGDPEDEEEEEYDDDEDDV